MSNTIDDLCSTSEFIVCVCPPHAAESVAQSVVEAGFRGLYCDGNAIAPQKAVAIGSVMSAAGIDFVDGSIIGPPAWKPGTTRFYLSGPSAAQVADLFAGTVTEAIVIGDEVGRASALKMVFASQTKGFTALQSAIQAVADRSWGARRLVSRVGKARSGLRNRGTEQVAWRYGESLALHGRDGGNR